MFKKILALCCICSVLLCCGCSMPEPVPDQAEAEQTARTYMQDKYSTEIKIRMTQTRRISQHRYEQIRFTPENDGSDREYEIYVAFDPEDQTRPVVVCENYMCCVLEPLLTEWLNDRTGASIAETVNCSQNAGIPDGFRADFPCIEKPEEAEELIRTHQLSFDHIIYTGRNSNQTEQKIRELLPLFSDDSVTFLMRKCDNGLLSKVSRQFREDGAVTLTLPKDEYSETRITSF